MIGAILADSVRAVLTGRRFVGLRISRGFTPGYFLSLPCGREALSPSEEVGFVRSFGGISSRQFGFAAFHDAGLVSGHCIKPVWVSRFFITPGFPMFDGVW
jgi:hypothetical protein